MPEEQSEFSITQKIILLVGALFVFVGISGYFVMIKSEKSTIENQSLNVAEIVARQASAALSVYSKEVLDKLKQKNSGYSDKESHPIVETLPIPAQFMKEMASSASESSEGLYKYRAISKWNLANNQYLDNDFLKYAWNQLEQQDQANPKKAIDWKPIYRVENFEGKQTFLYLRADPASQMSCVNCHNQYETRPEIIKRRNEQKVKAGKTWKQHQLLGGIFVQIPVEDMQAFASENSKKTLFWILSSLIVGLSALAFFFSKDVIKARSVRKLLFWQARHDVLTCLPNRTNFEEKAQKLIDDANASGKTHAMCFLDLDQFKLVNDTCGHAVGDELLCNITKELQKIVISPNLLARLGGDEFGVLLTDCSLEEAKLTANKLTDSVKNYQFVNQKHTFDIGVSIGIAEITEASKDVEQILNSADLACYMAKERGKNKVEVYLENNDALTLRKVQKNWVSRILRALEDNRINIYSQKIVSVSTGCDYNHYEILARLIGSNGEVVQPQEFIPAAERYKLMTKLDLVIIDKSLSALKNHYFNDLGDEGFISINLSGESLSEPDFLLQVKRLMMKHKVNPKQICFEITESAAVSNKDLVKTFMKDLKKLHIKFALDDFGTGLSSLTYLKEFPVDYLKIDGSFIKDIMTSSTDRSMVEAINSLAHSMGLKTVAEYVETQEVLQLLKKMNIDYAQGYLIQKPTEVVYN